MSQLQRGAHRDVPQPRTIIKTEPVKQDLLEENLSREELQALKNNRTGMFLFQISWIMVFVSLVIVNWQLRFSPEWNPPQRGTVDLTLPAVATAALLVSAFLARRGLKAVQAGERSAFLKQWLGAIGLGALFVAIIASEWFAVQPGTVYAQVFQLMTGFHALHAVVIGAYMARVYLKGQRGRYDRLDFWAVEAGAKLWYFVVIAWILFYVVIYWV